MDKTRDDDVRRGGGAIRFSSRQIHNNNNGKKLVSGSDFGDDLVVPLEKPKKQRLVKKLSAVNRASSSNNNNNKEEDIEMGCNMSDRETDNNDGSAAKKTKPPKKQFLDDSNGVDHASVPRRLRSAMKKRGRESLSPPLQDSKKLNHTNGLQVESPSKKDDLKKSKLGMKQGSSDWPTKHAAGPITKDEEEVAETLYALAGMFPNSDGNNKSKLDTAPSEAKLPALPDSMESPTPAIEVAKEDVRSTGPLRTSESTNPSSNVDNSVKETAEVDSLNEPRVQEQSDLNDSKKLHGESESCVPRVNLHSMILSLSETEHNADKTSCNPLKSHPLPELNRDSRLKQASQKDTSLLDKKAELVSGATTIGSHLVQYMVMEPMNKGPGLWPGLSPMVLHDAGSQGSSLQSSAAKVPAWLDALGASKPSSLENGFSIGKVSDGASTRRSLNRSAAHVHICRLIQNLKTPESKDKSPVKPEPLRTAHEGQKLLAVDEFGRVQNNFNGVISGNNIGSSASGRNLNEVRNTILQHNRLLEDRQQNAATTQANTLQKQSFDFLSLSTGGGGAEATNSSNRNGNHGIAPSSQFQVPYLHSFPQHQGFMTLPMPQTRYPPSAYPDQCSTSTSASSQQVQSQLPPYLGPTRKSTTFGTEQQQQQQLHQHQQQLWAAHLAAQYRPAGASTAVNPLPSWVNGRYDPRLLDPKYASVSQQQRQHQQQPQLVTFGSSFPPARAKRQDHRLPLVLEEVEGGFRTSGTFPLQLLCNERL